MMHKTPKDIAEKFASNALREVLAAGISRNSAAPMERAAKVEELQRLAQGIEADKYPCFIREAGEYLPVPADHCLLQQVAAFLDNRGQPICKVERTLDLRGYAAAARALSKRGETVRFMGMNVSTQPPPDEKVRCTDIMINWQTDLYLPVNDKGDIENAATARAPTEAALDKAAVQAVARVMWSEDETLTYDEIIKHSNVQRHANGKQYKPETLRGWLTEMPDNPRKGAVGRPKKNPTATDK